MQDRLINKTLADPASIVSQGVGFKQNNLHNQPVYPVEYVDPALKNSMLSEYEHARYSIMTNAPPTQLFLYETLGMFLFIYGITCYTNMVEFNAQVQVSLVFAICFSGYLCGANFNPTITLSNCMRKQNQYTKRMFPLYFAAQLIGCFLALMLAELVNEVSLPVVCPSDTSFITLLRIFASEMTGTFTLVFFILQVANPNTTFIQNQLSGFASIAIFCHIGRTYATSSFNAINPVIVLTVNLIAASKGDWAGMKWCWLWILGDVVGAVIATHFYDHFYEPTIRYLREKRRQSQLFGNTNYFSQERHSI